MFSIDKTFSKSVQWVQVVNELGSTHPSPIPFLPLSIRNWRYSPGPNNKSRRKGDLFALSLHDDNNASVVLV